MTTTLLAGILVAFLATTLAAAYRRAPTRLRCPTCGEPTQAVRPPFWLRKLAPALVLRWCPSCSWEGVGRKGPAWVPGRKSAHACGFTWGRERFPVDFGFRFAPVLPPGPATFSGPPAHPSGFRFSAGRPPVRPAHPSGFTWSPEEGPALRSLRKRLVFRFAKPVTASDFAWRARR